MTGAAAGPHSPEPRLRAQVAPSEDIRRTDHFRRLRVVDGLEQVLDALRGLLQRRGTYMRQWQRTAVAAAAIMEDLAGERVAERHEALVQARQQLRRSSGQSCFPAVEAATLARIGLFAEEKLGLRPYPEQFCGVLGLCAGNLMEMATGEGKTLTLAMAAVLACWRGRPCHVVTANDYLARRDARGQYLFFRALGVTAEAVIGGMDANERRRHYQADIVYTTAKELVADFLRDRLTLGRWQHGRRRNLAVWAGKGSEAAQAAAAMVQRGFGAVFVDEADHILIDEAATPLIISRHKENPLLRDAVLAARAFVAGLQEDLDYRCHAAFRDIDWLPAGEAKLAAWVQEHPPGGILRQTIWCEEWIRQALIARHYFLRDKQYVIKDGKLLLIDEGTGRQMPERSWRQGMHQAIEAKEGLELTPPAEVLASISFQRFFRRIPHLAGVTGTAYVNRQEFWRVYRLAVFRVPTHRPVRRRLAALQVLADIDEKWQWVADRAAALHAQGRPLLIGTRSIAASHALAAELTRRGLTFALLNAVQHEHEAEIVAAAGLSDRITIATNMAGRGTDIRPDPQALARGGLVVIATERHEAKRIDQQLFGRCARQGEPGEVISCVSLRDEIFGRYLPRPLLAFLHRALRMGMPGSLVACRVVSRYVQWRAERMFARQRIKVLRQDRWLEESLNFEQ